MARLVATIFVLTLSPIAVGAHAAEPVSSPTQTDQRAQSSRSFKLPEPTPRFSGEDHSSSRIFAGRELMPNGVIGVGMFGPKAEKGPHSAATARDLSVRKQRKAAVGFSLKF